MYGTLDRATFARMRSEMGTKKKQVVEVSGGGKWEGDLWLPGGVTPNAQAKADEFGNNILTAKKIEGKLFAAWAFDNKGVFQITLEGKSARKVLMPEHGGLNRDLQRAIDKWGDGVTVRVSYEGMTTIAKGEYAGNQAHVYRVAAIL